MFQFYPRPYLFIFLLLKVFWLVYTKTLLDVFLSVDIIQNVNFYCFVQINTYLVFKITYSICYYHKCFFQSMIHAYNSSFYSSLNKWSHIPTFIGSYSFWRWIWFFKHLHLNDIFLSFINAIKYICTPMHVRKLILH